MPPRPNAGRRQATPLERRPTGQRVRTSRRGRLRVAWASIGVVLVAVAALVAVMATTGGGPRSSQVSPPAGTPVAENVVARLTSVPLSTIDAAPTAGLNAPTAIKDSPLTVDDKPDLLYIGAEFCPICAAERWPLYVALSKFGTFNPAPGQIHSAVSDGDIPTLTFYGTRYRSPYFTFSAEETTTNQPSGNYYVPLQQLTAEQLALWQRHTDESFPWVDFGGKAQLATAQYDPGELEGLTFPAIASEVGDNASTVGADIDGSAAVLIETICSNLSDDRPAMVCRAKEPTGPGRAS